MTANVDMIVYQDCLKVIFERTQHDYSIPKTQTVHEMTTVSQHSIGYLRLFWQPAV